MATTWALRLIGAMVTFVFTLFVYSSGQVIQYGGNQKTGIFATGAGGTALLKDSTIVVTPEYGVVSLYGVVLYGMPRADFTVKGKIRSEKTGTAIQDLTIVLTDTTRKKVVGSVNTGADGTFSISFTDPPWINTWVLAVADKDGSQNGLFVDKDTLLTIPADSLRNAVPGQFYSGKGSVDVELFLKNKATAVHPGASGRALPLLNVGVKESELTIRYTLADPGRVFIALYAIDGKLMRSVADFWKDAGEHTASMPREGIAAGAYFLKVQTAERVAIAKVRLGR